MRNSTASWVASDTAHHLHPFMNHKALHESGGARIITEAEGTWLTDSEGNKILDGMAGLWNVNVGYGREELVEAAAAQMRELSYYNAFFMTSTPPVIELAEKIADISPMPGTKVMFGSSGSDANETALRLLRYYWQISGKPNKRAVIGRTYGYHGSTIAATQLGGMGGMHKQGIGEMDDIHHVMPPYYFGYGQEGESEDAFAQRAASAIEEKIIELGADNVAAVYAEPIQGAGGLIFPPDGYWQRVQGICKQHDVLLVADEVICGFGRLGTWFGSEHLNIVPDIITSAKGITSGYVPLSATLVGERVANALVAHDDEFVHGYTYAGHPVACAVALKNIEIIERENLLAQVANDTGPMLQAKLYDRLIDHPMVAEVRGYGMLAAIELVKNKLTKEPFADVGTVGSACRNNAIANGLMMRAVRDTMILSPVLTLSHNEIDLLVNRAAKAIEATAKEVL